MDHFQPKNKQIKDFLMKNQDKVAKNIDLGKIKCEILSTSEEDLQKAAEYIRQGKLVAFPTETVYGLGANALNPQSVRKIFETKRRPLSDPVIVHINELEMHKNLVLFKDEQQQQLFMDLAQNLWPGPMTSILPANFKVLDRILTAQTDFVGIRIPKEQIAQKLIKFAGVPIAAPSANLFAHVSPTQAIHVFNDFYDQDIAIIDGPSCQCGVESTVIKIINGQQIDILRLGSYSENHIQRIIEQKQGVQLNLNAKKKAKAQENQEAPGQALKHYSPNIESFMLIMQDNLDKFIQVEKLNKKYSDTFENVEISENIDISKSVILDFNNLAVNLQKQCLKYIVLSEKTEDFSEVMNNLYDQLRYAENVDGAKHILIVYLKRTEQNLEILEFFETIYDKIYRCTSGKKVIYDKESSKIYNL